MVQDVWCRSPCSKGQRSGAVLPALRGRGVVPFSLLSRKGFRPVAPEEVLSNRDFMKTWTTQETAVFYRGRDAAGIAHEFLSNSVNGEDLLSFGDPLETAHELRISAFAAKKALRLRDEFLRQA